MATYLHVKAALTALVLFSIMTATAAARRMGGDTSLPCSLSVSSTIVLLASTRIATVIQDRNCRGWMITTSSTPSSRSSAS